MDVTKATPNQCKECKTIYEGWIQWYVVNGEGPFCKECISKGVKLEQKMPRGFLYASVNGVPSRCYG